MPKSAKDFFPDADRKPTLACIGRLESFEQAEETQTRQETGEGYYNIKVKLSGRGGSKDAYINLLFLPEWFAPGFSPSELDRSRRFVYTKNIAGQDRVSVLEALCGSKEKFYELLDQVIAAFDDEPSEDEVRDLINQFIKNEVGFIDIGYVLRQKREDTGELDEKGKKIKKLAVGYEVATFHHISEEKAAKKVFEKWNKRVEDTKKRVTKATEKLEEAKAAGDAEKIADAQVKLDKIEDFQLGYDESLLELPF